MSSTIEPTEAKAVVQDTSSRRRNDAPTSASVGEILFFLLKHVSEPKSKKLSAAHAIAATDSTAAPPAAAPEAVQAAQPTDSNAVANVELKIIFNSLFAAPATAVDATVEPAAAAAAPAVPASGEQSTPVKPRGKRPRRETQVFQSPDFNSNNKALPPQEELRQASTDYSQC
ncbi:hypothetical protein GCK72_005225 [Caenorhabditis remanei]|uniref:Uncharacterized protein n=1 Tax=Caenorhabditis remanei TaxID=31234 RepID=A0A6A5HFX8_CAERE|nr:hypothetical protein GCK72_005225 [Caenorhabditis remanei]KAF1765273.1 hypothetical protein GCK72_005225 [Caenorhabditis remanei]